METGTAHKTTPAPTSLRLHAGGREDCWSEGATESLIGAWGHRFLQLNRGNLRQKDWVEVAEAVNSRQNGVKPQRTDIQCKNRIDTLKRKYKLEKAKPSPSKWPFYGRLHDLLGAVAPLTPLPKKSSTTLSLIAKSESKSNPNPNPNSNPNPNAGRVSKIGDSKQNFGYVDVMVGMARHKDVELLDEDMAAYKELSRAILRFGEIYERIESAKQVQMMELEKQRLEFTKEMEFQRLNMFIEAQLRIEKMSRSERNMSASGELDFTGNKD